MLRAFLKVGAIGMAMVIWAGAAILTQCASADGAGEAERQKKRSPCCPDSGGTSCARGPGSRERF